MRAFARRRGIALALTSACLLAPCAAHGDAGGSRCGWSGRAPRKASDHELRAAVLCLVNQARARHGLRTLEFNEALRRSASAHSVSMVRSRSFSHYAGGSTVTARVARSGYLASASRFRVAENIAAGQGHRYGSPIAIVRAWLGSWGHRRNILDGGFHDFGVGVARGDPLGGGANAATYTLVFGSRSR
jgi:uncharacterized protein YkwD